MAPCFVRDLSHEIANSVVWCIETNGYTLIALLLSVKYAAKTEMSIGH